jgi:hypothetical protein
MATGRDTRHSWNGGATYAIPVGRGRDFLNKGGPLDHILVGPGYDLVNAAIAKNSHFHS